MTKTVLITGTSSGIGLAAARRFRQKGWNVVATMRRPDEHAELAAEGMHLLPLDVTDEGSIKAAVAGALEKFESIDVVVNNAGYGLLGIFEASSPEQLRRQIETNYFGVLAVMRQVLPHFRARKRGTFVNVTSVGGRMAMLLYSSYHASKFALEGFTESMQYELRPLGIRMKLVEPGPVRTEFGGRSADRVDVGALADYRAYSDTVMAKIDKLAPKTGEDAAATARVIYRAAASRGFRLRYVSGKAARALLFARWLLPGWLMAAMTRATVS